MKYGLTYFPTDVSMHPGAFAAAAEARGFESVWFAEHSHMPLGPVTPGPPEGGEAGLPREYYAVADPFVALSFAAAATTTLKLGSGICLVPQRDVFQTAKQVASLDLYSQGRFLFGIGGGWNQPELENHGIPHRDRFVIMREKVEAMIQLWTEKQAEYHGKFVDFSPCHVWPKPAQTPYPPIHVGGMGPAAIRRAVRYGDGWIPLMGTGESDPLALIPQLRSALEEAGRDVDRFEVSIYFCPADRKVIERCRDLGVTRVLFGAPSVPADALQPALDELAEFIE
ncbi:MAG: LLM class F420-dependent oxidoreductase [Deltaproteobacteria bacterium]|nr:LLM class F420-dependent oxidoreductase [Deltaproteobacteria bacterium]